jgi:hypothetical protein
MATERAMPARGRGDDAPSHPAIDRGKSKGEGLAPRGAVRIINTFVLASMGCRSKELTVSKTVRGVLATLAASAALAGCMAIGAQEKEGQLAAAGFVRQQADSPQKMAKLQALPQNTIVFAQRKRGNVYIYADAAGCNCAFIGNDAAYQQYQQIRTANNIAQVQETTALLNQEAALDWGGAWGPYAPGWY